jgi:hypothetical protein
VSHSQLGLPPGSPTVAFAFAATRLRTHRAEIGVRALEIARDGDPTLTTRHDELGLRHLLRDTEAFVERLALSVADNDPHWLREFADQSAIIFRRRRVPMDDLVAICEGLRAAIRSHLSAEELVPADAAIDAAVTVFRDYRRLAGDARKRNRLLAAIYKGA